MSISNDHIKIYSDDSDEKYSGDSDDPDRNSQMKEIRCINYLRKNFKKIRKK